MCTYTYTIGYCLKTMLINIFKNIILDNNITSDYDLKKKTIIVLKKNWLLLLTCIM